MIPDHHESFQRMIDESLAGGISAEKEQLLREHLATCAPCQQYLSANNRIISGLSGFSFEANPALNVRILEALTLKVDQDRLARSGGWRFLRPHHVPMKVWAAFTGALLMSFAGSALVYQMAKLLTIPTQFDSTQIQASVLVFWLLPSLCAALCLLAKPGEKRGIA
jgi:hypothetical protein